ncbi:MAG: hypothetical protein K2O54_05920 [Prevotella sp.]|nr:hypothetical protein [Prevotella sp.]
MKIERRIDIPDNAQNVWEHIFEDMLSTLDFDLVRYGRGYYGLLDRQGANLGGIEQCVFTNAGDIIERLDCYLHDSFIEDLGNELKAYNINGPSDEQVLNGDKPFSVSDFEWYRRVALLLPITDKEHGTEFVENHAFEFDVVSLVTQHFEEVNLQNISAIVTDRKIRIVSVTEKFSRNFLVLADTEEQATKIVDGLWNNGSLGDFNGEDYVPDSYICDDITREYGDWPTDGLELVNADDNEDY